MDYMNHEEKLNSLKEHLIYKTPLLKTSTNPGENNNFSSLRDVDKEVLEYVISISQDMIDNDMYILETTKTLVFSEVGVYGKIEFYYVDMEKWDIGSDIIEEFINKKEIR